MKTNIPYEQQVNILKTQLLKAFEYVELKEVYNIRNKRFLQELNKNEITSLILFASYAGTILRITYYNYIYKLNFSKQALWDALIMTYLLHGIYDFCLDLKSKEVQEAINKTVWPKWTRFGLVGGNYRKLIKMGEEFSDYMEKIKDN